MDRVRNPKPSLAQPLTWPADQSVRTLPCHRLSHRIEQAFAVSADSPTFDAAHHGLMTEEFAGQYSFMMLKIVSRLILLTPFVHVFPKASVG